MNANRQDTASRALGPPENSRAIGKSLDVLGNLGAGIKINILLIGLGLIPPLAALLLLHQSEAETLKNVLAIYIAAFLAVYYPFAKLAEEMIVLRQTRRINAYVEEVKTGRRSPQINLPEENGEEHDFLRLQRNIFWMVQGLKSRENRLEDVLGKLDRARRQVLESIEYAALIQQAFLPSEAKMEHALGNHFLFWRPRDGVGGDAYWILRSENHTVLAVFDCTGHGVPGAFLTLIVNSLFEQSYDEACRNDPGRLLTKVNRALKKVLGQIGSGNTSDEGFEGGVCCIDRDKGELRFAGARSTLLTFGPSGIMETKGDRTGVGFIRVPMDREYQNHLINLTLVDSVYMYTDGVTDQVGGPRKLPFGRTRLHNWLGDNVDRPFEDQYKNFEKTFTEYMGSMDQRDDATLLGFSTRENSC